MIRMMFGGIRMFRVLLVVIDLVVKLLVYLVLCMEGMVILDMVVVVVSDELQMVENLLQVMMEVMVSLFWVW